MSSEPFNNNSTELDSISQSRYQTLFPELGSAVQPTQFPDANWLITSPEVDAMLNGPASKTSFQFNGDDALQWFAGNSRLDSAPNWPAFAQKYTGHQFGYYNPDLGDGRGLLIGQIHGLELHVKGAGQTPYSRFGDGRAVLRSCVREFLASEALEALGIPTSRALGVFTTGEAVHRETIEPGAAMVRVCPSHIRFGHFEYAFHQNDLDLMTRLVRHCVADLGLGLDLGDGLEKTEQSISELAEAMFADVIKRTADMVAKWQAFGFCHGVMNTDNMSILGITFDFGPYGFLDQYDPNHICNHSDHSGRYAFDEQPGVALWNLNVLGHALSLILPEATIREALQKYQAKLQRAYSDLMREKLGLASRRTDDDQLLAGLLTLMQKNQTDYTIAWRTLCHAQTQPQAFVDLFVDRTSAQAWLNKYTKRLAVDSLSKQERQTQMMAANPKYILRNHLAQQAIEAAEKGDASVLNRLFEALKRPYDEQPEHEDLAKHPPAWASDLDISCSS
jgi:serine/tyrosine/threonine adenylyltransferase